MASKNKRKQTFKEEYSRSWDFIKPSRKGENHARCTLCSADFSIAASGRYDITQHIATAKHRSVVRKNATEFRSNLSTPVLSDTLITKMYWQAAGVPCHKRVLTIDLLAKCKKATMESIRESHNLLRQVLVTV